MTSASAVTQYLLTANGLDVASDMNVKLIAGSAAETLAL